MADSGLTWAATACYGVYQSRKRSEKLRMRIIMSIIMRKVTPRCAAFFSCAMPECTCRVPAKHEHTHTIVHKEELGEH